MVASISVDSKLYTEPSQIHFFIEKAKIIKMRLIEINADRYRQRLNKVIYACIGLLSVGSLSISQLLIFLFPSTEGSHFHWNLSGVVIAVALLLFILVKLKTHPFLHEVSYVWDLKQSLNNINRRIKKIETASQTGDKTAINILHFSYSGSRQLWELDNNTLTINHLTSLENKLNELAQKHQVTLDINHYNNKQLMEY